MRVQLCKDKRALEALLSNIDSQPLAATLADVEAASVMYKRLGRFSYLDGYKPTLSLETKLQSRYLAAKATLERSLARGVRVLRLELDQQRPDTRRIRRLYAKLSELQRDDVLDSLATPFVSEHPGESLSRIRGYRDEAQSLLRKDYRIGDAALVDACDRLATITANLKHEATDNATTFAAADLCRYIRREAGVLRNTLLEHSKYASTHYPQLLQHKGATRLEAEELARLYSADCIAVEERLVHVMQAANIKPPAVEQHQLIVGVRCGNLCDELATVLARYGSVDRFRFIPYLLLTTDDKTAEELLRKPRSLSQYEYIARRPATYTVRPIPAQFHTETWNLDLVHAPEAWQSSKGEDTKVAVIDTGIDYNHVDLASRFSKQRGVDFVNDDEPLDDNGHGTHVAGTIAGCSTGVAPAATLYAVKVLDMDGSGSEVDVLRGMEWAIEHADVINMSLGSSYPSDAQAELIAIAQQRGIPVACAAGNDGDGSYVYPASHPGAISVAAVDRDKQRASFSNHNDRIALAAPGVAIYSTWLDGGYKVLSGTSMAAPHVAGGCALLKQAANHLDSLQATAEKLGDSEYFGAGLIDLAKAVQR